MAKNTVIVWLGGHAHHMPRTDEFNMVQDIAAARVVLASGAPVVQLPCLGVVERFSASRWEMEHWLKGKNALCDYLIELTANYNKVHENTAVWSKVIWDVTAVAAIVAPETLSMVQMPRPIVTDSENYAFDNGRPHYVYVRRISRDKLYTDLFQKLANKK
jgi:inosine-uridine nucleoside N-ribohydrolase